MPLMLLLCSNFVSIQMAEAREDWNSGWNTVTWDVSKGCIHYHVRYYQTHGGDGDGHCGAQPLNITQATTIQKTFKIKSGTSGSLDEHQNVPSTYTNYSTSGKEYEHYIDFDVPVSQSDLNTVKSVKMTGTWWRRGIGAVDNDIDFTYPVSITAEGAKYTLSEPKYSSYNGTPCIQIDWSRTTSGNIATYGDIVLCDVNNNPISCEGVTRIGSCNATKGSFYLFVTGSNPYKLDQSSTMKVYQSYTPSGNNSIKYISESSNFKVKAYPQIQNFSATADVGNLVIKLNWDLSNSPSSDFDDAPFILKTKKTLDGVESVVYDTIPYKGGTTNYSYSINLKKGENDSDYDFEIFRKKSDGVAGWDKFTKKTQLKVSTDHCYLEEPTAVISDDNSSIVLSWKKTGSIWTSGSAMNIVRTNLTTSTTYEYVLEQDDYSKGNFKDELVQLCNRYAYKFIIIPGGKYDRKEKEVPGSYKPTEIGTVKDITVSKGYYSDKVELSWKVTSAFDEIAVERREFNGSSDFKKIQNVSAMATSDYVIEDKTCLPGVMYEYRVYGLTNCAGEVISSKDTITDYGFRNPTADFYGMVTYENGQSVDSVEVRLETEDNIKTYALSFDGNVSAIVPGAKVLVQNSPVTLQAWVKPTEISADSVTLIRKSDLYDLGLVNGRVYFKVKDKEVVCDSSLNLNDYTHVTAVYDSYENLLQVYLNGVLTQETDSVEIELNPNTGEVVIGENFKGVIDEVRLWSRALLSNEIKKDYTRYIVGNEQNLDAYYTFNFVSATEFFDQSFSGSDYNDNTGTLNGTEKVLSDLSQNQLTYKGYTQEDGTYTIRAVPYYGNGTAYSLTPRKGTHQFIPTQEIRFISESVPSHTVNFTDKSSFEVSGIVVYNGGEYPVEGVQFQIDGVTAVSKTGYAITTDADGLFTISVPVGTHEVKAVKNGHTFELDGRICNSDSMHTDRNYQDVVSEVVLYDNTKVKYIGRVCGGTVQEELPVGFSLSKNNLADNMKVVLTPVKKNVLLQTSAHSDATDHFICSGILANNANAKAQTTLVEYNKNDVTINVNNETGEFVAWVYPIEYTVNLAVNGHGEIPGDGSSLDLSGYSVKKYETYEYKDTVFANGKDTLKGYEIKSFVDSIEYNQKQVFTKRYRAQIELVQLSKQGRPLNYFGKKNHIVTTILGDTTNVILYNDSLKSYTFDLPTFISNETYSLKYSVFEEYPYYTDNKGNVDEKKSDRVAIEDVTVKFNNKLASRDSINKEASIYEFTVGEPDMTTAIGTIAATFTYGDSDNPTSVSWTNPLGNENGEAYVLGAHQTGTDFVTAGPNHFLAVLRDPPGSNSYSYLEKGVSFTEETTYTGSFDNEGSESWTTGYGTYTQSLTGSTLGGALAGVSTVTLETEDGATVGIEHSENYTGSNSKSTNVTTTTRFQTSDDPIYVGANGDVYIGYSTNLSFGSNYSMTVVNRSEYDESGEDAYEATIKLTDKYALVKNKGISIGSNFKTLFAYTQVHVEQVLIPNIEALRNSLLVLPSEVGEDTTKWRAKANETKTPYYLSKVGMDDDTFGEEGSYDVIYPDSVTKVDTIAYLNQSIANWYKAMSDNDSVKVNASKLLQNYSFQAGANIEYSESYSTTISSSHGFDVTIGGQFANDMTSKIFGATVKFSFEEHVATSQGREWNDELEMSHAKGFVLQEDGDDDYLSVDVYYENEKADETYSTNSDWTTIDYGAGSVNQNSLKEKDNYSMFIFKTRGGATGCPYEDAYKAVHWEGHENEVISAATMKLEEPSIDMPKKFIENVPSGEEAYFTIYMKNNSETGEDQWFDLRMVDASNPYGAVPSIDGNSMSGFALDYLVPAGDVLEKTLAISKGSVLNYDDLALVLASKCQADPTGFLDVIADTVYFSVHFIPSCTDVKIAKPNNNWTYNTNCATDTVDGVEKHYMPITISGFDVNYTDFEHLELQYKASSASDNDWITLGYYYKEDSLAQKAIKNGLNAFVINPEDGGNIYYNFYMDNLPDQKYDLRSVSFCNINNELYDNPSEVISGVKDMYNPRLFGSPKPANGVLTIEDDIRIDFNETIADGMLTVNNFEVTGIRNGAATDHSVAISLDGVNDYLATEAVRNFANKDLTFECWVNFDSLQNATFFSHGDANNSIEMGMDASGKAVVKIGGKKIVSEEAGEWEKSSWNHVALVYDNEQNSATAYVNYVPVISNVTVPAYTGNGVVEVGRSVSSRSDYFNGKVDQFRIWNDKRSSSTIQANSAKQLSGNDVNLVAYYEMDEAKGNATEDKARGANLVMKGGSWALPEGRSASFDGNSYVAMDASSSVITSDMDFTLEFWFNASTGAKSQTILSNGDGVADQNADPSNFFSVGFDSYGNLVFRNNGEQTEVNGDYADNNWHNFTLAVNRSTGMARIYMDGKLNTYFSSDKVGRIASDKMYAGARVWHADANTVETVDQYFTGKVDEIRLWNLYRQQSQIESFYNQKVDGNEMGLMLYYPFEHYITWQGTAEMQFTLSNKTNATVADAVNVGNVEATTNIPPVKNKGAVASLKYDWVVNNDGLIINLTEQDYRIEKTIVNFTVNRVQDVNGNYILSPITWSAYIDRNQLKWIDDAVTINKKANESYKFEAQIVNNGGAIINYNLNNMPSWLSASTTSGAINPMDKQTIEFEVAQSLAVGTYDEVVYLTNSNNVTEPLKLNVTVEGNTPKWNIDPSKYQYNMVVFAQMKFDNAFSNDAKDMLAAFYNDECVGVANMSYDKTLDMWYAMLTVYSSTSKYHELEFRMWDASRGCMVSAVPSSAVKFTDNKIYGTPTEPIVFSNGTVMYQNIPLSKGWNWVSFNLANEEMADLASYLANGTWNANSLVKTMSNGQINYSSYYGVWVRSKRSFKLDNMGMFKIYSDIDQVLSVSGSEIDLNATELTIGLMWNWISYLPSYSMPLKEALSGYEANEGDLIKSNDGFAMYYGNEWIGSLKNMQPNCGYMLQNNGTSKKTLKYPSSHTSLRSANIVSSNASAYESNMSIIAYVPEKTEGDVVRAVVGGAESEVVEVALTDDYALQFINIAAKSGDNVRFTLERNGVVYESTKQMSFISDAVHGTPDSPVVLRFNVDGVGESMVAYPNPVVDKLNIAGNVAAEGDVKIELFDVAGSLVYSAIESAENYELQTSINMAGYATGSYMLKVSQNDEVKTFKIVKK